MAEMDKTPLQPTAPASTELKEQSPSNDTTSSATKDRPKVIKHHKLSARMALLSKGGQKNSLVRVTVPRNPADIRVQRSSIEGVESPENVTSDYDSCFETDVECVEGGGGEGVRRDCVDYDDADSGVIENSSGLFTVASDLEDLKEVDLIEEDSYRAAAQEQERIAAMLDSLDEKIDIDTLSKEALDLLRCVPSGYVPLPHQVGGHRHIEGKLGFMRKVGCTDILYKPVQYGSKGSREVQFYEMIFNTPPHKLSRDLRRLKELIPKYYGLEDIRDHFGDVVPYFKLEDIASRFRKPCIMDIKVGKRVWDDFAEQDKIDRELKKFPAQEILGFRIIGMRVLRGADYVHYNKEFGRSVTPDTALDSLREFFLNGTGIRDDVICALIGQLQQYREWMESQTSFKLFATSLLIVYEGDASGQCDSERDLLDVRLVDFAHAYSRDSSQDGRDENFLFGLKSFIDHLEQLK